MVIVDTSVWIDYFSGVIRPETEWLHREVGHQEIGLTDLICCELLQGVREDRRFKELQGTLAAFPVFSLGGLDLAVSSAKNYRVLRKLGITIRSTIDCLIATFCLTEGYTLLHHDSDFDPFEKYLHLSVVRI